MLSAAARRFALSNFSQQAKISSHMGLVDDVYSKQARHAQGVEVEVDRNYFDLTVTQCRSEHKDTIMALTAEFLSHEPQTRALGFTFTETRPMLEHLVDVSLCTPYSVLVVDNETDRLIGFRLVSLVNRKDEVDVDPVPVRMESERMRAFWNIITRLQAEFLKVNNDVNKVLRHEITFITPSYQRAGIANRLLHYGFDLPKLKQLGVDGLVSEMTSETAHSILARNGYSCVARLGPEDYRTDTGDRFPLVTAIEDDCRCYFRNLREEMGHPNYSDEVSDDLQ